MPHIYTPQTNAILYFMDLVAEPLDQVAIKYKQYKRQFVQTSYFAIRHLNLMMSIPKPNRRTDISLWLKQKVSWIEV